LFRYRKLKNSLRGEGRSLNGEHHAKDAVSLIKADDCNRNRVQVRVVTWWCPWRCHKKKKQGIIS